MDPFSNARSQRRDDVANRFSHLFNWPQPYTQVGLSMSPRLILRWVYQWTPGLYSGGFVNVPQSYK